VDTPLHIEALNAGRVDLVCCCVAGGVTFKSLLL